MWSQNDLSTTNLSFIYSEIGKTTIRINMYIHSVHLSVHPTEIKSEDSKKKKKQL